MSDEELFRDFMRRIRAGDEQAAAELVRRYEPLIRRKIRINLEGQRLGRLLDSMDVCQSVLASFFVRAAAGQFDLENPQQLIKLLVTMARNKLATAATRQQRQRRDNRRVEPGGGDELAQVATPGASPSRIVAGKDLLERVRRSLDPEERQIADLRGQGYAWAEVAAQMGGTAEARRKQLTRALERVTAELGLDEDRHE
jgi:RNA polymerase sigma-70 factor (ECF subfamily)